ncbi:hypothetical protein [Planococcus koreensis]|uniref:hypothetical protein n=1 Tax=Planococcus koreensis TaxID=112331 RepID=UPI0039FD846A
MQKAVLIGTLPLSCKIISLLVIAGRQIFCFLLVLKSILPLKGSVLALWESKIEQTESIFAFKRSK